MARRRKLLVADDSLTIQKVVSLTFSDEGVEVVTASDGRQALQMLAEEPPDVVLADTYMPGPNGYEICEHIKGDPHLRHIPVVLLVGTFEPFNEAEARKVGADMVLTKPFQSIKGLVSKVGSLFGGRPAETDDDEPITEGLPAPPPRREETRAAREASPLAWQEPRVTETNGRGAEPPVAASAAEVSFADIELDDPMIEARDIEPVSMWDETGTRRPGWPAADARPRQEHAADAHAHQESDAGREAGADPYADTVTSFDGFASFGAPPQSDEGAAPRDEASGRDYEASGQDYEAPAHPSFAETAAASSFETPAEPMSVEAPAPTYAEPSAAPSFNAPPSSYAEPEPSYAAPAAAEGSPRAASSSDDVLLDLSDFDDLGDARAAGAHTAAASAATDDDFILDLGLEDEPAAAGRYEESYAAATTYQPAAEPQTDAQSSLAEAAHGEREAAPEQAGDARMIYFDDSSDETPTLVAEAPQIVWEDSRETFDHAAAAPTYAAEETTHTPEAPAFGQDAENVAHGWAFTPQGAPETEHSAPAAPAAEAHDAAPASAAQTPSADDSHAAPRAGQITLADVSPEVIDAIARRVVERMSEQVVREIAWEVVPELSELLIKQRLDEKQ